MRSRRPYPRHPFPFLLSSPPTEAAKLTPLPTKRLRTVMAYIQEGARVLFDAEKRRAFIYRFSCGIVEMAELTVRSFSYLVKQGYLHLAHQEGRLVHYAPNPLVSHN